VTDLDLDLDLMI